MLEAMLARPLRQARGEIYFAASNFPTLVSELNNHAHRAGADDPPFAFGDVGNFDDFAVDQRRHGADSDRVANAINVAAERRLPMVNVFRRAKHFEVQTWPPLAPNIDRVALIKIDSPRGRFRLPGQPVE